MQVKIMREKDRKTVKANSCPQQTETWAEFAPKTAKIKDCHICKKFGKTFG